MKRKTKLTIATVTASISITAVGAICAQTNYDKYSLTVPGGLAFSEFRGYEGWEPVSVSYSSQAMALIVANPEMIAAYKTGVPENGEPFPDGAKMAKIHWVPEKLETFPAATVPGTNLDVDFMVKDSTRLADSGGWGYAVFKYDLASERFRPGTLNDRPPQGADAKCGFACHTVVKGRDYVFTEYRER